MTEGVVGPDGLDKTPPVEITLGDETLIIDLDAPKLPQAVEDNELRAGGYPYTEKMRRQTYDTRLEPLQIELVKLQTWLESTGERIVCLFEGRDAAGKGGAIKAVREHLKPRQVPIHALPKPSDRERTQWYFQRYSAHLPAGGEMALFDRSWYNRAGVEPVMGFCTDDQCTAFLDEAPRFEAALTRDGIRLFKFYLSVGQETQIVRFHKRRHDPRKIWKLSGMDIAAMTRFDAYTAARDRMLAATHTPAAPWTVILSNDKRRARLALIQHLLTNVPYKDRDLSKIGTPDPKICASGRLP